MIEQLKSIRDALQHGIKAINHLGGAREAMPLHDAMPALTQLETMVGEQNPVAFVNGAALSRLKNGESVPAYNCWGSPWPTPLYAAPVVQQPQAEAVPSIEQERKEAEQQYSITAFNYPEAPIGSRDWVLYWAGWLARSTAFKVPQQAAAIAQQKDKT